MSDESLKEIIIGGPVPGNWFVIAFKNWTNPNNDRIEQQGLSKSCVTKLKADLYIKPINPIELLPGVVEQPAPINDKSPTNAFSIFIPEGVDNSTISIHILKSTKTRPALNVLIKPRGLPSSTNYLHMLQLEPENDKIDYSFYVYANTWHYIVIESNIVTNESFEIEYALGVNFDIALEYLTENDYGYEVMKFREIEFFKTFRKNHRDFFLFDIDVSSKNGTSPEYFNFSSGVNYGFKFDIYPQDIGGMLTAIVGLVNLKDSINVEKTSAKMPEGPETIYDQNSVPVPEKLVDLVAEPALVSNVSIEKLAIICLHLNEPGIPEWPAHCKYGNTSTNAAAVVSSSNRSQSINVPFPEAGEWFLTTKMFCVSNQNLSTEYHTRKPLVDEAIECNGTFVVGIGSVPCEFSQCGPHGSCYHYMSGGFVYTTCVCRNGYRGWDCTDDTDVVSLSIILFSTLLLTLSNLLFIPSVYFAFRRKYYTEALIYFFTMFFSSFYHACDSGEDIYSFCLVRLGVLQFCDFYCGLLAIWVTLIAMANIRHQYVSLAHMLGAILLAFGTEYDKQSLTVFLAPALTGLCIISVCWAYRCKKSKKLYPSKKYLTIFLPIGGILVILGLVCYAFLQTKQNYHIIHSVWHMVMAISILCLLPNKNTFLPK